MKVFRKALMAMAAAGALLSVPMTASAADLRAAPVVLETLPGSRTTTFTLTNDEAHPLKVQIRVMKWSMENGKETLTPTNDVVASPPLASLKAKQNYLVRLVRVAKTPVTGEESYRILVDEIPDSTNVQPGSVQLAIRLSIPLFISDAPRRAPDVTWSVARDGNQTFLVAKNSGNRRLRLSDLDLNTGGRRVYGQPGLVGYVLANSEMRWAIPASIPAGNDVEMTATADTGPLEVQLVAPDA